MIAIIGAGGHAKCVYECFYLQKKVVYGFFDDDPDRHGREVIDGMKVIGIPGDIIKHAKVSALFMAIGNNRQRMEKYACYKNISGQKGTDCKYSFPNAIHEKAHLSPFSTMGEGNFVMGYAVVNPNARIGNCCIINTNATVGHDCVLENGVQIGPGVNLAGGSRLEEGVFIGIGAKVAPNVTIGKGTVVGAGSVVLEDLPANTFCCGIPAK